MWTDMNERCPAVCHAWLRADDGTELRIDGQYDWRTGQLSIRPGPMFALWQFAFNHAGANGERVRSVMAEHADRLLVLACGQPNGIACDAFDLTASDGRAMRVDLGVSIGPPTQEETQ